MNFTVKSFYEDKGNIYIDSIEISAQFNQLSNVFSVDFNIGYIDSLKWCISSALGGFLWYCEKRGSYALSMDNNVSQGVSKIYVFQKDKVVFIESLKSNGIKLPSINYVVMTVIDKKDKWLRVYYKDSKKIEALIPEILIYSENNCTD